MSDSSPGRVVGAPAGVPAGPPASTDDWPAQAADTIVKVVGQVRDKTTGPAITAARGIVYGLLAGLLGTACAAMLAIALVRVIDVYLPDDAVGGENTWLAHLIVGVTFSLLGLFLWSKRRPRDEDE